MRYFFMVCVWIFLLKNTLSKKKCLPDKYVNILVKSFKNK